MNPFLGIRDFKWLRVRKDMSTEQGADNAGCWRLVAVMEAMTVILALFRWLAGWHRWLDWILLEVFFDRVLSPPVERWMIRRRRDAVSARLATPVQHIAFIMDGNRRFAHRRGWSAAFHGHLRGFQTLEKVLEWSWQLGVRAVTVYAFSIENFKRSPEEVTMLMALFKDKLGALCRESELIRQHQVAIRVLGDLRLLPEDVRQEAQNAMEMTQHHRRSVLNICCPYTSTHELSRALELYRQRPLPTGYRRDISSSSLETMADVSWFEQNCLMTGDSPPLDILIRTSGEKRLSDFLAWQCSDRCNVHFLSMFWPDFRFWDLLPCVLLWQPRHGPLDSRDVPKDAVTSAITLPLSLCLPTKVSKR